MNIQKNQFTALIISLLLLIPSSAFAAGFFQSNDVIWEENKNVFFKYTEHRGRKLGNNNHPAKLNPKKISAVLSQLTFKPNKSASFFSIKTKSKNANRLFTHQQVKTLSQQLSKGLGQAKANQDVIFALEKGIPVSLGLNPTQVFVAGRAFVKDNKLNLIIGDYNRPRDIGYEQANDPTRIGVVKYNLDHGSRSKPSRGFKIIIDTFDGIENKRNNWLVIDTTVAANAYITQERRRKKAELAKKRKELREILGSEEPRYREQPKHREEPVQRSPKPARSLEERLTTLKALRNKGLITDKEYKVGRAQILKDL
jgi:hypothetical protein